MTPERGDILECARDFQLFVTLFGFTPAESLVAGTSHGGAMMGRGDPLDDIALLQDRDRINLVMKDGRIYRDELSVPVRSR
jgi:imidazolonepropionase-like amidohydrolase